jgi:hypothetical protein
LSLTIYNCDAFTDIRDCYENKPKPYFGGNRYSKRFPTGEKAKKDYFGNLEDLPFMMRDLRSTIISYGSRISYRANFW